MSAKAVAAGVRDEVFWASTPREVGVLLHEIAERDEEMERRATLRAGIVASAIYNVHRRKGAPAVQPRDFIRPKVQILDPKQMRDVLSEWARSHNEGAAEA